MLSLGLELSITLRGNIDWNFVVKESIYENYLIEIFLISRYESFEKLIFLFHLENPTICTWMDLITCSSCLGPMSVPRAQPWKIIKRDRILKEAWVGPLINTFPYAAAPFNAADTIFRFIPTSHSLGRGVRMTRARVLEWIPSHLV